MPGMTRTPEQLCGADLEQYPVWEYHNPDDVFLRPVLKWPVDSLRGRIVGTKLRLCNGSEVWGILTNIFLQDVRKTEHFLSIWVERGGKWCGLARYHDVDRERRGPASLAAFLELSLDQVFPISYDISTVANGLPETVHGMILTAPRARLNRTQLIELALEDDG
jgi:hypothetical protein